MSAPPSPSKQPQQASAQQEEDASQAASSQQQQGASEDASQQSSSASPQQPPQEGDEDDQDASQQQQQQSQGQQLDDQHQQAAAQHHHAQQHHHAMHAMHAQAAAQQGGMMPYGVMSGGDMQEQYDQEQLMAALASNQMMMSHQQRAEQDAINAQAQGGMNGNVEICRAYLAGRCSRGGACRFVHVENGTGHQPPNPHLCRDWLNGTCIRGTNCRFQHQGVSGSKASIHNGIAGKSGPWAGPGQKTIICHQWASRGRCDYGTACKFAHQRLNDRWNNESALDEKKLLAAMLSGLTPQEALTQALNTLQNSNPAKFGGPVPNAGGQGGQSGSGDPNSPSQQGQQDPNMMPPPQQLVQPQKRADGSLILCRFFARHGYCKYGVACKFHHQPVPNGAMFPPYGRDPMLGPGGAPNQSLASLLALGLKASMMSNDHLIANHAALLAASMNQPGVGPPRMNSPGPMGGQPLDPQLANVLAAYLQQQPQQPQPNPNLAALLSQLQGGPSGAGGNGSISPTQLGQFDGGFNGGNGPQGQDAAFQAFLQQQHQANQANAFQNAFSPAAANAFNAIPNLNSTPGQQGGPAGGNGQPNGLSLPQMISTAFRSTSNGANQGGNGSSLSNNLSLMSLKPFADSDGSPAFDGSNNGGSGGHARSNSSSFNESGSSFTSPSLLTNDGQRGYEFGQQTNSAGSSGSQIIGPSSLNGSPNASTLSALFSSSLNGPFLH